MYFPYPSPPLLPCFNPLKFFKTIDHFYTPLYEKGIKENQNKPMETTQPLSCKPGLFFGNTL